MPDLKRITKEDFPAEYQQLIEKLAFPLNSHMEQVRNLFNNGIDFENLTQELITLKFQTNEKSNPTAPISFKSTLRGRVKGVIVCSANITSKNNTYMQNAPFISFSQNNSIVNILNITGLAPETSYEILVLTIS